LHHNKQHFELWPEYVEELQKNGWKKGGSPQGNSQFLQHFIKEDRDIILHSVKCPVPSLRERFGACAQITLEVWK
jgi:hypothetical protein